MIAPHTCLGCGEEGAIMCEGCRLALIPNVPSRCYRCHKVTLQSQTCSNCRRFGLKHVWAATDYDNIAKDVVFKLKFGRASVASNVIAKSIHDYLPLLSEQTKVTYIPTAPSRVRVRGYDQAKLIARSFAQQRDLQIVSLLGRRSVSRQVGSTRKERFAQLENAFFAKNHDIKDAEILIIDDVLTTGATLESAAKILKQAGAKKVSAAVFAQS